MKSAKEDYANALEEVEHLIKLITRQVKRHEKSFKEGGETNWGYVGDMTVMEELLRNALRRIDVQIRTR